MRMRILIGTTVVRIRILISMTVVRIASAKIQYRTDGNSRTLLTYYVTDPSINFMWYSVFEVGRIGGVGETVAYMYVGLHMVGRIV